jgi:hypothetical protein
MSNALDEADCKRNKPIGREFIRELDGVRSRDLRVSMIPMRYQGDQIWSLIAVKRMCIVLFTTSFYCSKAKDWLDNAKSIVLARTENHFLDRQGVH